MKNKLGLIINPWAGIGGTVALKGSDGEEIRNEALRRGATPQSASLVKKTLELLPKDIVFLSGSGSMGEDLLKELGFKVERIYDTPTPCSAQDTMNIAKKMIGMVDLLLFAGGDGTARDIYSTVGDVQVCLGIPTGVKMQSEVFATSPEIAGRLVNFFTEGGVTEVLAEVVDLDEEAYRENQLMSKLFGYLRVPRRKDMFQNRKASSVSQKKVLQGMAMTMIERMEKDVVYAIGAGSTLNPIMEILGLEGTLLGIDMLLNQKIIKKDCTEADLLKEIRHRKVEIVVTPIGGQGYVFGRGNQQFSPKVLRNIDRRGIHILATREKLYTLKGRPLYVYTSDTNTDRQLEGHVPILTGYNEFVYYRMCAPYSIE